MHVLGHSPSSSLTPRIKTSPQYCNLTVQNASKPTRGATHVIAADRRPLIDGCGEPGGERRVVRGGHGPRTRAASRAALPRKARTGGKPPLWGWRRYSELRVRPPCGEPPTYWCSPAADQPLIEAARLHNRMRATRRLELGSLSVPDMPLPPSG